jgi:hypothetical protein
MKGIQLKHITSFFSGLTLTDCVLAAAFTALVTFMVNSIFPPKGWIIGLFASLVLIVIAKRKRDNLLKKLDDQNKSD